jgi:hypothetical protein
MDQNCSHPLTLKDLYLSPTRINVSVYLFITSDAQTSHQRNGEAKFSDEAQIRNRLLLKNLPASEYEK